MTGFHCPPSRHVTVWVNVSDLFIYKKDVDMSLMSREQCDILHNLAVMTLGSNGNTKIEKVWI